MGHTVPGERTKQTSCPAWGSKIHISSCQVVKDPHARSAISDTRVSFTKLQLQSTRWVCGAESFQEQFFPLFRAVLCMCVCWLLPAHTCVLLTLETSSPSAPSLCPAECHFLGNKDENKMLPDFKKPQGTYCEIQSPNYKACYRC